MSPVLRDGATRARVNVPGKNLCHRVELYIICIYKKSCRHHEREKNHRIKATSAVVSDPVCKSVRPRTGHL